MNNAELESVNLIIVIGVLLTSILAIAIIVFVVFYQRKILLKDSQIKILEKEKELEILKAVYENEESQKEKIARNLHDEINPLLALLKLNLSRYKIELRKKTFNPETINSDQHIIDNTIEGLRAISMDLIPSYLLKNGLLDAIEDYINQFKKNNLINAKLNISVSSEKIKLYSLNQQLNIYRIWLEVFHNICKHTNCNRMEINLKSEDDFLKIIFEHNGKGISNKEIKALTESTDGIGLKSIKARSLLLNAAINYHHNDSKSLVEINFPIKQNKLVNN